jgi:uncharacterized membrane protein
VAAAPNARRSSDRPLGLGLLAPARRRNRRLDWLLLRWQARLDARWADRVVPWALAGVLFLVYAGAALARVDRLDAGPTLARYVQGAWQLAAGQPPELTIGADGNLFAERFPALFLPLAAVTRILPATGTLVVAQAASLALGIVPLWLLARNVAHLRVGAAAALAVAYALHPAVADLDLADFHPQSMALSALLAAAYFAEQQRWARFGAASLVALLWSAELGLVVATLGVVLFVEGERRIGIRAVVGGLGWTLLALFAVQAPLGRTGLVAPDAFDNYGDGGLEVLVEMLRNPFRIVADLLAGDNVRLLVWVLAPLLFLPLLSLRKLVPALPLTALVLVADVPSRGPDGGGRTVPLVAFAFVAATFALARLGRPSVERVLVDRRVLVVVAVAALAAATTESPLSPYEHPWEVDVPDEEARRDALAVLPPVVAVRVPADLAIEVADREHVDVVDPDERDPAELARGVEALVIAEDDYGDLDAAERHALRRAIEAEGMVMLHRDDGFAAFVRILEDGALLEGRLPDS